MNLTVGECVYVVGVGRGEGGMGEGGMGEETGWGEERVARRGVTGGEKVSGRSAEDIPSLEETLDSRLREGEVREGGGRRVGREKRAGRGG